MGLIVALSGAERFATLLQFKADMATLTTDQQTALKEALRQRFTPNNSADGCQSATLAVKEATKETMNSIITLKHTLTTHYLRICRTTPQLYDQWADRGAGIIRMETHRDVLLRIGRCEDWLARRTHLGTV